jgi:regulatory protein
MVIFAVHQLQKFMAAKANVAIPHWIYSKMKTYCAYQERCLMDIRLKLKPFSLQEKVYDAIIAELVRDNFLDEERYARVFASGKFRIKQWGKNKIYAALQQKQIPELFILEGLNEIDQDEYIKTLKNIITKKKKEFTDKDKNKLNLKLAKFAYSKGFEKGLIWEVLNK